jgi:hypothetical protein
MVLTSALPNRPTGPLMVKAPTNSLVPPNTGVEIDAVCTSYTPEVA